jgi:hypothetical protein
MVVIEKHYFDLDEVSARWGLRIRDIGYLAENGDLRVSTRLEGVRLERGIIEIERDREFRIPHEREWFSGIVDLRRGDAFRIFRYGRADVAHFHAEADEYTDAIEPNPSIAVQLDHLVIRRSERERIEALNVAAGRTVAEGIGFQHSADYRNVRLGTFEIAFGVVQAHVISILHRAALTDSPWRDGKVILAEAGATSRRMSDVFKSQSRWRQVIISDGRGRYRLRLKPG